MFANYADQRLYLLPGRARRPRRRSAPADPRAGREPGAAALRYADFTLSPDRTEVWCVQERHDDGKVTRAHRGASRSTAPRRRIPAAVRELVTGSDFYAFPTPSPDGQRLAWICWNHPRMPWDGTELRVAPIEDGVPGRARLVKGGVQESVLAPRVAGRRPACTWSPTGRLVEPLPGGPARRAAAGALPGRGGVRAARSGSSASARTPSLGDGRLAVLHGRGGSRLGVLDPDTGELADLDIAVHRSSCSGLSADGTSIAGRSRAAPATPRRVVRVDAATGKVEVLRQR